MPPKKQPTVKSLCRDQGFSQVLEQAADDTDQFLDDLVFGLVNKLNVVFEQNATKSHPSGHIKRAVFGGSKYSDDVEGALENIDSFFETALTLSPMSIDDYEESIVETAQESSVVVKNELIEPTNCTENIIVNAEHIGEATTFLINDINTVPGENTSAIVKTEVILDDTNSIQEGQLQNAETAEHASAIVKMELIGDDTNRIQVEQLQNDETTKDVSEYVKTELVLDDTNVTGVARLQKTEPVGNISAIVKTEPENDSCVIIDHRHPKKTAREKFVKPKMELVAEHTDHLRRKMLLAKMHKKKDNYLERARLLRQPAESAPDEKRARIQNNYGLSDLGSDEETDKEDNPRKPIPEWAEFAVVRERVRQQIARPPFDPFRFFGQIEQPDLNLIFRSTTCYPKRGSSAVWNSTFQQ